MPGPRSCAARVVCGSRSTVTTGLSAHRGRDDRHGCGPGPGGVEDGQGVGHVRVGLGLVAGVAEATPVKGDCAVAGPEGLDQWYPAPAICDASVEEQHRRAVIVAAIGYVVGHLRLAGGCDHGRTLSCRRYEPGPAVVLVHGDARSWGRRVLRLRPDVAHASRAGTGGTQVPFVALMTGRRGDLRGPSQPYRRVSARPLTCGYVHCSSAECRRIRLPPGCLSPG